MMIAKVRHKRKLIEYIGNPENDFPTREAMAVRVCQIKRQTLYSHFSPDELSEIESEALEVRRTKYAAQLTKVDQSVLKKAAEGDMAAAKLAYQRFENWSERKSTELTGDLGLDIKEIPIVFVEADHKEDEFETS
jgi:hypothetical protein